MMVLETMIVIEILEGLPLAYENDLYDDGGYRK